MPIDYKIHIAICDDVKEDRIQNASMTKEILKSEEISPLLKYYIKHMQTSQTMLK